jgi:Holliday junction DNA helicase RuvA
MLASIRGTVLQKMEFSAVVDCNGFGMEVILSRKAAELCRVDAPVFLLTLLQVSDAGPALFGFADEVERSTFKMLILVKGVGGKVAMSVLQYLSTAEIVSAVANADSKLLTAVPGIGKKTAERICFELADRIHKKGFEQLQGVLEPSQPGDGSSGVLDALEALGFDRASAHRAYKAVVAEKGASLDESDAIMSCLRVLQLKK